MDKNELESNELLQEYHRYLLKRNWTGDVYRNYLLYPAINKRLVGKTLDVGCGVGNFLDFRIGTTGIDINPYNIRFCQDRGFKETFLVGDEWPFSEASFDSAILDNVLEHLTDPIPLLAQIRTVLKTGGRLIIGVPGPAGYENDADHKVFYTQEKLKSLMETEGFTRIDSFYTPFESTYLEETLSQYCYFAVFTKDPIRPKLSYNIDIILPYYNGSKYIKDQLDSIQKCKLPEGCSVKVLLIDDCSSVSETKILESLLSDYSFIEFHRNDENLGVVKTVEKGLQLSTAPYVMLADHDDFWLPEKIQLTMKKLLEFENSQPSLVFTDLKIVDEHLNIKYPSMFKCFDFRPEYISNGILINNIVTGCTVAFNRKLIEISLPFPKDILIHDHWLAVCATFSGNIAALTHPTVLYRQHDTNLIGANYESYWFKLRNFIQKIKAKHHSHLLKSDQTMELIKRLQERNVCHQTTDLEVIANAMKANSLMDVFYLMRAKIFNIRPSRKLAAIIFFIVVSAYKKFKTK